jgi:hypothetical protein
MPQIRRSVQAAVATAAALLVLAPNGATAATTTPKFLSKSQIPTAPRYKVWNQSKVITGLVHPEGCEAAFPDAITKFRFLYNDAQGNLITQYVAKMSSTTAAKKLVRKLEYCGSKAQFEATPHPDDVGKVTFRTYGDFDIENGLLVRGVRNSGGEYPEGVFLDAIGRDGRYVMQLTWPFETEGPTPKDMWVSVSKKAMRQLLP